MAFNNLQCCILADTYSCHLKTGSCLMTVPARIRAVSKLSGDFLLRSGKRSNTYFDKYRFESDPALLKAIADAMAPLLPPDTEVLGGLEMGGIPIATMLSQVTGLPAAFIRKEPKEYGTCQYAEGPELIGRKLVLIEDVVSSGGAISDAAAKLRADGIPVAVALCVIDRETGGKEALAMIGIELRGLYSFSQIEQAMI
jgi:orotate phosphoribosyltransferase